MERVSSEPRPNWQQTVESQGFHFHTAGDQPYWDESAYYRLTSSEVDAIEAATYALNRMSLAAVDQVIGQKLFGQFGIPEPFIDWIIQSWENDEHTIYGRFDLAYDGQEPPKLLEYNADTPTSVLEAAVIQWHWFQELHPDLDQYNSIHERLIEAWKAVISDVRGTMYFASLKGNLEDYMTVNYLRDTAMQAGLETEYVAIEDIGWDRTGSCFVDVNENPLTHCFKLYPWEWLIREEFGPHLTRNTTRWLEAPWKMILSNKAILPLLYEMFPRNPYLLRASFDPIGNTYVKKPLLAREGANIEMVVTGEVVEATEGDYGGPFVYQELHRLPNYGGNYPVIGSWMVNGYACGIGIREDTSPVTQNLSRFVLHVFAG